MSTGVTHQSSSSNDNVTADWSERQLRALAAIFATISAPRYKGESRRHAELAASALNEVAEPSDLRLLKLLLSAFESGVGSVALAHGTRSFSMLPRSRRERVLMRWATSPVARQRTFFQTLKRLASFFAYADPGPAGANPRWADIEYEPARNDPAIPGESIQRALIVPSDEGDLVLDADVVVVGSGAGGGVIAARLAEAGHSVLVVEAGRYVSEPEMPVDELAAFDRLYLDHGMTSTSDVGISILSGSALGGGTLINWATCIEPPIEIRSRWGAEQGLTGFDGPQTDDDVARLRTEIGFADPPSIGPKDRAIVDGARALGWEAAPTQRDAVDCGDCGSCGFGCRRGAKLSGQRLHLAQAAAKGARLLTQAWVRSVTIRGAHAEGVVGVLSSGHRFTVRARSVVVAAGALRTPLILLGSGIQHDQIGRNLHLHPTAVVAGRMPARVEMWHGTLQAARSLEFMRDGIVIESAPGHPGLIALAFPWQSAAQQALMMGESVRFVPFIGICRDEDAGRVRLSSSGRARIDYRISGRDANTARLALVNMATLARAAGADRVLALATPAEWHDTAGSDGTWQAYLERLGKLDFAPNRATLFSAHQMGTARAGSDPRASATDPFGRVRRNARGALVNGLYVGDASLFPTAVGVNPMVTVMALGARVARAVDADL
jgi:choline dehydrogenase-like flavoprotein